MRWFGMVFLSLFAGMPAWAGGDKPGDFDYYVMALSWSANWCAMTGDDRHDPQCDAGRNLTFTLHGLWPQFEQGYPSDCFAQTADPSRSDTAQMADIMGGAGVKRAVCQN